MFGFGKSNTSVKSDKDSTEIEPLKFHPELIEELKLLQERVYDDYKAVALAFKSTEDSVLESSFKTFKKTWHTYLMEKNIKLYSFLKHSAKLSASQKMIAKSSRAQNNTLSRELNRFLSDYLVDGKLELDSSERGNFEQKLSSLGDNLIKSMKEERQNLFPVYLVAET